MLPRTGAQSHSLKLPGCPVEVCRKAAGLPNYLCLPPSHRSGTCPRPMPIRNKEEAFICVSMHSSKVELTHADRTLLVHSWLMSRYTYECYVRMFVYKSVLSPDPAAIPKGFNLGALILL